MILAWIVGFAIGAVVSIPLGALGAIMIDRTLREGLWAGLSLGLMSAGTTALCCEVSLQGFALLQPLPKLQVAVQALGLALLIFIGVRNIFFPSRTAVSSLNRASCQVAGANDRWAHHLQDLFLVLAYTFLNPTSYAFWANLATVLHFTVLRPGDLSQNLIFSAGVGVGSAGSQYVSLILLQDAADRFPAARSVVRRIGGVIFTATVITFGYSLGIEIANLVNGKVL